ncbi:MAG: FtsX-like permease family protein, partial [Lentisphaeria bacterium]|nr:FtsX-like permease family protein [Lentisphaeria bacterium]
EIENRARVCVVGQTIVNEVFGGSSPIDCTVRIKNVSFTVIGVLKKKGANMMGMDEDDVVVAPWTTIRLRITGLKTGTATNTKSTATTSPGSVYPGEGVAFYPEQAENLETDALLIPKFTQIDQIMVGAVSPQKVDSASAQITAVLRDRHNLMEHEDNDFHIRNSAAFMETFSQTTTQMSNLLLAVALISLIVGGVGIMNIMLVSVTERTREIGLRMAVGARSRDILTQFLVESMILCAIGGVIGIVGGHGAALVVHAWKAWPVLANTAIMAGAFLVSTIVGVVFGFYPAWKASRLDPIDALRYE